MFNIHDTANQLERDLRETSQYKELKEAHANVLADEEASSILNEFQTLQQKLHQKQHSGEEITEEEAQEAQVLPIKMNANELTKDLMDKEQGLNALLTEINGIIMKPVQEIYEQ